MRSLATAQLQPLPVGLLYYAGVRCPSCGCANFNIGRIAAQCARCDTALVIADTRPTETILERTK